MLTRHSLKTLLSQNRGTPSIQAGLYLANDGFLFLCEKNESVINTAKGLINRRESPEMSKEDTVSIADGVVLKAIFKQD